MAPSKRQTRSSRRRRAAARGTSSVSEVSLDAGVNSAEVVDENEIVEHVDNNNVVRPSQTSDDGNTVADAQHSGHYSLRTRTTQNKNPAKTVGLAKRTRDEITIESNAKKAKREAEEQVKAAEKARADQHRALNVGKIAALEDQHAQQVSAEDDLFVTALGNGSKDTSSKKVLTTAQHRVLNAKEGEDGVLSDRGFELADMAVDEIEEVATAPPKKALTAAEKRTNLRHSTLAEIASTQVQPGDSDSSIATPSNFLKSTPARRVADRSLPVQTRNVAASSSKTKATPSTKVAAKSDAFSLSWRKKLHRLQGDTLSTPVRQASSTRKASATDATAEDDSEPEVLGGLHDEDVEADRDVVIAAAASGARARAKQLGIRLTSQSFDESDEESDKPPSFAPSPTKAATGTRTKKGKSFSALPDYLKPVIKTKIIPSVLEYYGTRENVWDPDATKPDEFQDLLKSVLNTIFPRKKQDPKKRDVVYIFCRQRIYDWHHDIQRNANNAVRDAIRERQNNSELSEWEHSEDGIIEWLQDELDSGAAYYGKPATSTTQASEVFQSSYVLKTLAFHLTRISGSVMPDPGYPRGALALCGAAVQRAFDYYIHEKPHGVKQKDFSANEAAALTAEWLEGNVSWAMGKESRFEAIIDAAMDHMKDVRVAKKATILANTAHRAGGAPRLYEPPSSP